ncbi:MAG TPA: PucR family transcriptional regulator ligand-binding domain-containing protein [Actinospica sp.]|nr:PucR family transcriptional regulator ligand-binding domain-containing protein [Actinospica sp.]
MRELLGPPCALTPVTDQAGGLDRDVRWVVTTDLPDPSRYLQGGELIVTGMIWRKGPQDAERFVSAIAAAGASALAAGNAGDDELPADLLAACRKHRLPLLRVPGALAFATLTEYVVRRISGQRASDLGSVLERHQRLVAAGDPAQALGAILELIAADLGLACWVIDSGGTAVASSGEDLGEPERAKLARTAISATTLPTRVVAPAEDGSSTRPRRTVFPITDEDRITDWYLVLDGDWRLWDPQRRAVVDQVTDVLKAERARLADRVTPWRADAERLLTELAAGTAGPDVACRLTGLGLAAGPVGYRAVAVTISDPAAHPAAILEAAFAPYSALIAHFDADPTTGLPAHAVALTSAASAASANDPATVLRDWLNRVTPGLATRRVGVGLSDHVTDPAAPAAAFKRAVADARHALRVAITKPAPVTVVRQADIASHALLLASIPDEVRSTYRDRMLGPILDYDRAHNSELEVTLESFLRASSSWTRCASAMHIHVNTLRYRISRIEELVGRPLSLLETQADLLLALDLRES